MKLSRRHAITGAAVALAGCAELEANVEERADGVLGAGEHPLSGTTTIAVVDESASDHDLETISASAAAFWTERASEYADVDVTFTFAEEAPDIELVFVDSREELDGCQEHASSEVLGCAPLLTPGHSPERPITVEVVAANRPVGDVRITVQHELGHTLGLDHDDEPAYIMSNDVEDRLPEYARRREILESFENTWTGRNSATREYNRAVNRWNDGEYESAVPIFENAADRYRTAGAPIDTAIELERGFDGMNRPDTVDRSRLRGSFDRASRWIELAAERSDLMADSSAARAGGNVSEAREHRREADDRFSTLQTIDFPAPVDIAGALGLIREEDGNGSSV